MEKEELKKVFKEKLGIGGKQFEAELKELTEELGTEEKALGKIKAKYKGQLRSPAKTYKGVVVARRPPFDTVANLREEARDQVTVDRIKARQNGYVDAEGRPLDTREQLFGQNNPNYGKPLPEHNWIRAAYGIVETDDGYKPFRLTLRGEEKCFMEIPLFKAVQFRANEARNQPNLDITYLNQSVATNFAIDEEEEISVDELLTSDVLNKYVYDLASFKDAATQKPDFVLAKVYVAGMANQPSQYGAYFTALDDESLEFDADPNPSFVPEDIISEVEPEVGDEVIVTGQVNQNTRNEQVNYVMNVWDMIKV